MTLPIMTLQLLSEDIMLSIAAIASSFLEFLRMCGSLSAIAFASFAASAALRKLLLVDSYASSVHFFSERTIAMSIFVTSLTFFSAGFSSIDLRSVMRSLIMTVLSLMIVSLGSVLGDFLRRKIIGRHRAITATHNYCKCNRH